MDDLNCTCKKYDGPTETECRLSARLGITPEQAHKMLDLFRGIQQKGQTGQDEAARAMAARTGLSVKMVQSFLNTFDRVLDEIHTEGTLPSPSGIGGYAAKGART